MGKMPVLLLFSVFVVATCGLIYELVSGTLASYLLGDSVTQFSTIIGVYLFSMGIGSFFSKYFDKNLLSWFIQIEILVGFIGGFSSTLLFLLFEQVESFRILLYFLVFLTGTFVGLEIPLLMRILEGRYEFKELVSRVFTFDYIGALLASVIFPMVLVPNLGLLRTSYFFGMLNIVVALVVLIKFKNEVNWSKYLLTKAIVVFILLILGFVFSTQIMSYSESLSYHDKIIYSKSSPYQRIVITHNGNSIKLHLNGNLQFSSLDEYRYHEALVHPIMGMSKIHNNILVLGGGDGMAVRELLKYNPTKITLVDLDPKMTQLFQSNSLLTQLNDSALLHPTVKIYNSDAFQWLKTNKEKFDIVIIDFPDPSGYSVGKLYTTTFYQLLSKSLTPNALTVIQSTSPYVARKSFWCIDTTLQYCGFKTLPYHTYVPSFGEWGYVMAFKNDILNSELNLPKNVRFISNENFKNMLFFPADMAKLKTDVNKLNNQLLVHYFEKEWATYTP